MKTMIGWVGALGVCGLATAHAADLGTARLPAKVATTAVPVAAGWAGPYLGLHVGYLSGRGESWFPATGEFHLNDPKGFAGGIMAGYNRQWGRLVAGLEADVSYVDATQTVDTGFAIDPSATQFQTRMSWNSHLRGRLGYAFDSAMIFMAGGLALAGVENRAIDNLNGVNASWRDTRAGWTLGAGVDWRIGRSSTVRLEYLYDDYGSKTLGVQTIGAVTFPERDSKLNSHTLRVGLNWQF